MSTSLLQTKLIVPPHRPNLVLRPRLLLALEKALLRRHQLVLVSAKAGTGKTTLVSEWAHQQERPVAWISLDANDNDPRRFLSYFVAALSKLDITFRPALLSQLESPGPPRAEALAADLINDIAAGQVPFLLILDDYHLIHNEWIHQVVGFLTEHQPPHMQLVLLTRVDPPFSLARLRGRGQIAEIRGDALRFLPEEATQFFNGVMDLALSPEAISALEWRTEGWIVGLQMAALSLQGLNRDGDLAVFIDAFSGTNRFILDYLLEEVLAQQPAPIQEFLLDTSILERMSAGLCDALRFDEAGSSGRLSESEPLTPIHSRGPSPQAVANDGLTNRPDSRAILAQLERSNLFVVPLDNEQRWYRYHHLFADLLRSTLRQRKSDAEIRQLHRRASRWHQSQDYLEEAMIHAIAAQDYDRAAAMIDENIVSLLARSEGPTLLSWIEKLPQQITLGRPWVDVYRAYTLALSGRPDEAEPLLEEVETRINPDTPRASELRGHVAAIRSYTANLWGDSARVIEMATRAERDLPKEHLVARAMATYALTVTYFAADDMERSSRASLKMLEIGKKLDRQLLVITALCDLASTKKIQGRLHQAKEFYSTAHQWMADRNGLDSRVRCPYEVGMADLLREWNQLEVAFEHARTGINYCRRFDVPSEQVSGTVTSMRILQAQGDVEGAFAALREAERIMESCQLRLSTQIELKASRVVQWLAVGDSATANRWAEECRGGSELEQIAIARLRLAQGRPADAQSLLDRQSALAEEGGRSGRLIEILSLKAMALNALDRPDDACDTLSQALALARPDGYRRLFLDLGWALGVLLARLVTSKPVKTASMAGASIVPGQYERDLLDAFQKEREAKQSRPAQVPNDDLTERELEVLRLLAEGISNKEIAGRLVVAPSTVKQHLKNIYGKLGVHGRMQAVERGRELELI